MDNYLRSPKRESTLLFLLIAVFTLTRLPLLFFLPLVQDEAIYSIMIEEQAHHPTLIPTLFLQSVSWKPILFYWVYASLSRIPLALGFPLEAVYRFPSFIFGLLTIVPLFLLLRKAGASESIAFFSVLIFLISMPSLYPNGAAITDTLFFFLAVCSLYLYADENSPLGGSRFLAAGAFAFLAFFTKYIVAFMIPVLAVAFFLSKKDERAPLSIASLTGLLKNRLLVLSLLAVPLALIAHLALLDSAGLAKELYISEFQIHSGGDGLSTQFSMLIGSLRVLMMGAGLWFALSLFGFWRFWKENLFMSAWFLLTIFPILSGYFMVWYYLPVMPAIAYFAAMALLKWDKIEKPDMFFMLFFTVILVLTLISIIYSYITIYSDFSPQKEAAMLLQGKSGVLVLGGYAPSIPAYLALYDAGRSGTQDFGWILNQDGLGRAQALSFLSDYHTAAYPVTEGSFSAMFTQMGTTFRKASDLTKPNYVVMVREEGINISDADLIYDSTNLQVYRMNTHD
jgi:4-amino-4-deoxy-L-arabinose transferase-like glycosyltransferase